MRRAASFIALIGLIAVSGVRAQNQPQATDPAPTNDAPNPYRTIENHFRLPDGRKWGSTAAIDLDRSGRFIWVGERCSANSCLDRAAGRMSTLDPVLRFDMNGTLVKSFGAGLFIFPHGIFVDHENNVWLTDGQDDAALPARGSAPPPAPGTQRNRGVIPRPGATMGHQVYKFSPDGTLLMTLGKKGGAADPDYFFQPNDVLVKPNGDIFVAEGHGPGYGRVLQFTKDGKLIKVLGTTGSGPGQFNEPHALAMDSRGRLFVADRSNNRIQIFDENGRFVDQWKQFSRPSGMFIDKNDTLYVTDGESNSVAPHEGWKRGIRIGSLRDGKVVAFIPDPDETATGPSAAEGVAVGADGTIYAAEVGKMRVLKYVKR